MRKSYDCEVILIFFQIVLRNNLDPDLDEIFGRIRIQLNTDPKHWKFYFQNV